MSLLSLLKEIKRSDASRFRSIFENSLAVMLVIDCETRRIVDANSAAEKFYGWKREQLLRMRIDQINTLSVKEVEMEMEKGRLSEQNYFNFKHRLANGQIRDVEAYTSKIIIDGKEYLYTIIHDITIQKNARNALFHSQYLMRYIIEHARSGVAVFDKELHYIYVSQRYLNEYRISQPDIIGKHHYEIFPEMPDKWKVIHQRVLAGAIMSEERDPFVRENGEIDFVHWECRPWYEADGVIGGMILYSEIINERIQHENEIRTLNSNLEILIDSVKELSSAQTIEAVAQIVTVASRKLTGSDGATFIVKDGENCFYVGENAIMPLWAGKRFPLSNCISGWVMASHEPAIIEDIYSDGRVPIELYRQTFIKSLVMIPVNTTQPVGAIGNYWKEKHLTTDLEIGLLQTLADASSRTIENINLYTELEQRVNQLNIKQQALVESESKYRLLAENSGDVIFVLDRNLKYTYISPAIKTLRGFEPEEAMTQDIRDSMTPESYERAIKIINEYFTEEIMNAGSLVQQSIELELIRKDKTTIWAEIKASVYFDETNKPAGIIGVSRDISERRKFEEDLIRAKEKAEESDRLKTAFLQNISHEIRTPLNAIVGFSTLMGDDNMSPEKRKEFGEIIQTSNDQLLSVISGIISLATLEAGQEQCTETEANINEILKTIYDQLNISAFPGQVDFSYQTALPDNMAVILTDPVKLTQILLNLVSNALKFTHKGHVKLGYELANKVLKFYVEDTGIGIPEDLREIIFERFRQVDNSPTRRYGGTGLGLALSKGYAGLLGGKIELASEPGKGSVFSLILPYKPAGQKTLSAEETTKATDIVMPQGKLIMVVEDEINNYMLVNEMLTDLNLHVNYARNGLEAVTLCDGDDLPDLILMDIKMPVMDGMEARKIIKETHPQLKIIAMTAYALETDREQFLEMGFDGYLEKPMKKEALARILYSLL